MLPRGRALALVTALLAVGSGACGDDATSTTATTATAPITAARCTVLLHGKGDHGVAPHLDGEVAVLQPDGNGTGWGGRQWNYFPDADYQRAVAIVRTAVDGASCQQVIVGGFSNGASFAAKLLCRGERLGLRLVGVVVDDPVPDHAVDTCARPAGVALALTWSGALAGTATPGWRCADRDWTCEGGTTVGIDAFAAHLGVSVTPAATTEHRWDLDDPALRAF